MTNADIIYILRVLAFFAVPGIIIFLLLDYVFSLITGSKYEFDLKDTLIKVHWIGVLIGFINRIETKKIKSKIKSAFFKTKVSQNQANLPDGETKNHLIKNLIAFLTFNLLIFIIIYFSLDLIETGSILLNIDFYFSGVFSFSIISIFTYIIFHRNLKLLNLN